MSSCREVAERRELESNIEKRGRYREIRSFFWTLEDSDSPKEPLKLPFEDDFESIGDSLDSLG